MSYPLLQPDSRQRLYAFCLRHLYPLRRDFDLLSDMLYWPIIDILLWGITSQWLSGVSGTASIVVTVIVSLILWNVIWRSQSEVSRNLIDEIWNNNLVNLFSTPLALNEWVVGVLILSLIKMGFTISVLVPIVFALYAVNIFTLGWWLIPFFGLMVMTGWWIGFVAAGIVIRWGPKLQTVVWTLPGILLPFSATYFPLALMPGPLKPFAYLLPTTYIFESMRSLVTTGTVNGWFIVASLVLNVVYLTLSLRWFVVSFRASLKLGLGRFN
jgi:ABC-2 type transport system permease protein